jgi:hypothetical protein
MEANVIQTILEQGFGYVLFIGAVLVIAYQAKISREDNQRYADDIKEITVTFTATAKDLLNGNANLQQSINTLTNIINTKK